MIEEWLDYIIYAIYFTIPLRFYDEFIFIFLPEIKLFMDTVKTASFEYLISLAQENPEGGYTFVLDGSDYQIQDVLEISKIAQQHGYIVIY